MCIINAYSSVKKVTTLRQGKPEIPLNNNNDEISLLVPAGRLTPGQQSVQNSGTFRSHKVLASFHIYLFINYHHVNVSQGRIVGIFFCLFFSLFPSVPSTSTWCRCDTNYEPQAGGWEEHSSV